MNSARTQGRFLLFRRVAVTLTHVPSGPVAKACHWPLKGRLTVRRLHSASFRLRSCFAHWRGPPREISLGLIRAFLGLAPDTEMPRVQRTITTHQFPTQPVRHRHGDWRPQSMSGVAPSMPKRHKDVTASEY